GIRDPLVTGVQTCALPICPWADSSGCTSSARGSSTAGEASFWPPSTRTMCSSVRRRFGRERGADGGAERARAVGDAAERQGPSEIGSASCREVGGGGGGVE